MFYLKKLTSITAVIFPNATTDESDLPDVLKELLPLVDSWEPIGIGLRLQLSTLDEVGKLTLGRRMERVIQSWLKREYNVEKFAKPTWRTLVEVVANRAAGNDPDLALEIARKHPGNFHASNICISYC